MKPLQQASLTADDLAIVARLQLITFGMAAMQHIQGRWIFASDRCDVQLMLDGESFKKRRGIRVVGQVVRSLQGKWGGYWL